MITPRFPANVKQSSKPSNYCSGCGHSIVLKTLGKVIEDMKLTEKTAFTTDIGCSLLSWDYFDIDTLQTHHGRTTAAAVGQKRGKPDAVVIAYMGDGGGYAIGLQNLIHACFRNEKITVILINNSMYSMTGGQMAPTTLPGEVTETSPDGVFTADRPFMGAEYLSAFAHEGAYIARTAVSSPLVVEQYLKNAIANQVEGKGFSFVEVLSYCPTNWKTNAKETFAFLEDMKKVYPLGEIKK